MKFKFSVFVSIETPLRTNSNTGNNPFQLTTLVRCGVLQDSTCLGTEINQSAVDLKLKSKGIPRQAEVALGVPGSIFPFHTCTRQWEAELYLRTSREAYSKKRHRHHVDIM